MNERWATRVFRCPLTLNYRLFCAMRERQKSLHELQDGGVKASVLKSGGPAGPASRRPAAWRPGWPAARSTHSHFTLYFSYSSLTLTLFSLSTSLPTTTTLLLPSIVHPAVSPVVQNPSSARLANNIVIIKSGLRTAAQHVSLCSLGQLFELCGGRRSERIDTDAPPPNSPRARAQRA
jgi:hypothetical protein